MLTHPAAGPVRIGPGLAVERSYPRIHVGRRAYQRQFDDVTGKGGAGYDTVPTYDAQGEVVRGSIQDQTHAVFDRLIEGLALADATLADVVQPHQVAQRGHALARPQRAGLDRTAVVGGEAAVQRRRAGLGAGPAGRRTPIPRPPVGSHRQCR